ncbi:MAG: tRNA pseudouridine synthase A, partial [Kiloniellales bacterium]|nr:tRNA pseudouridine synthase A [Kiloniellales bacterium]
MTRFKLVLEYDGGPFVGWQRQHNGPSVQQALEEAVLGFCGETVTSHAAGRTDAGVHALGQVVHFDLERKVRPDKLADALNAHLRPAPVAVLTAEVAAPDFHARYSAVRRTYLYRIANRRAPLALERGRAWFVPQPLDAEAMHAAAQALVGKHD